VKPKERKALGKYIRWVADEMELRDWHIDLMRESAEKGTLAQVHPTFGRKHVEVRFCARFRALPPEEQRNTVVHELVHLHTAAMQSQVEKDLEQHLAQGTDRVFFDSFQRNLEYAVDGLANALAKHMPLISWPKS